MTYAMRTKTEIAAVWIRSWHAVTVRPMPGADEIPVFGRRAEQ
jgi:hypothetical protein